jgi:LPS sulfotransferase NodH
MSVALSEIIEDRRSRPGNPYYRSFAKVTPRLRYLIAMTPRSGSTLLARQLSARGIGHPQEFLSESFFLRFEELFPAPGLADFEAFVLSHYTSIDGVFGMKSDWTRFNSAQCQGFFPGLHSDFDLCIYLTRRDLLSQSISLTVAQQSGVWEEIQARYVAPEELYANLAYDEAQIMDNIAALMEHEYQWVQTLQRMNRPVIRLTYEEFVANPDAILAAIGQQLGLSVPHALPLPAAVPIQPVPSRVNSEWRLRVLAKHRDLVEGWARSRGLRPGI